MANCTRFGESPSDETRRKNSESQKRAWAKRRAAMVERVMAEEFPETAIPTCGYAEASTPTTSAIEAAKAAAEELYERGCGHIMEVDEIAAIITKHLARTGEESK